MLMELSFATDWRNGYDGNYPLTWIHSQWDVGVFHGGCNVVFCDEHVQLLTEDWRDDFEGLQPMPMPDAAGCPPYFYAFRDRTRYRDRW